MGKSPPGKGYRYAHDFKDGFVPQEYLPEALQGNLCHHPAERGYEKLIQQKLTAWRELKSAGNISNFQTAFKPET